MTLVKDIWRVGFVKAPLQDLLRAGTLAGQRVTWLPDMPHLCFAADPFGLWRNEKLYVFQEIYDYRERIGKIEVLTFDAGLNLLDRRMALEEPWHLSYPFLIEEGGETYMLPEAHKSGRLTLYRAAEFPHRWVPVQTIALDHVAIDATPLFHNGLWWLFHTPATTRAEKVSALHVAYAERLTGPWTSHRGNPVHFDPSSARPGGTPVVIDGVIVLPVQDCRHTYGGGMKALRISRLTPEHFEATASDVIPGPDNREGYTDGFHTLTAAGPLTFIDAKKFHLSAHTLALDVSHFLRKKLRRRSA